MRTIIVDDEHIMINRFIRISENIPDIYVVGKFEMAEEALEYAEKHTVELAFLDVEMPVMNGIELAKKLHEIRPDILIVFVSAYDEYIRDCNQIGGDYYIVKPYEKDTLMMLMEKLRLLSKRQNKKLYIETFGRFLVMNGEKPIPLTGKAKEILALIVTRRGREISNEEIYSTIWEGREYSNEKMSVFYNALRRLKNTLKQSGVEDLLISTARGQMVNTAVFDCDYYDWQDKNLRLNHKFEGEFLSEYSWGEYILANMMRQDEMLD